MSNSDSRSAVHDVLHIRELVDLICNSLDKPHLLSVMRTSRHMFSLVAPHVWRSVGAMQPLRLVIQTPSLISTSTNVDEHAGLDYARFELYAPFIQKIWVSFHHWDYYINDQRAACVLRTRQGALLPNLTTIIAERILCMKPPWLDKFLVPTVRRLTIWDMTSYSNEATSTLWENLAARSPAIEELHFFPMDLTEYAHRDRTTGICRLPSSSLDLQPFSQLRVITSWIGIFANDGLSILSSLPCLHHLHMYELNEDANVGSLLAGSASLPVLIELVVHFIGRSNRRYPQHFTLALPQFLTRTPRLERLTVKTKGFDLASALGVMSKLPLKHLSLGLSYFEPVDIADGIVAALPQLVTLSCGRSVYRAGEGMPKASKIVAKEREAQLELMTRVVNMSPERDS